MSVKCTPGWVRSTEAASDITGVMPEPAAIATMRPVSVFVSREVKLPCGFITAIVSPMDRSLRTWVENRPSATSLTPMRRVLPSGGAHSE